MCGAEIRPELGKMDVLQSIDRLQLQDELLRHNEVQTSLPHIHTLEPDIDQNLRHEGN